MIAFAKYQGLGNDFVIVEGDGKDNSVGLMTAARAIGICDRRRGIGADGVLSLRPGTEGGDVSMHIYNSDGSEAKMCGNGIRCVADYLAQRGASPSLRIETASGMRFCRVHRKGASECPGDVSVEMGTAFFEGEHELQVRGEALLLERVSLGNLHAVLFATELPTRPTAKALGAEIERLLGGPYNIGFAAVKPNGVDLIVHEHGAGLTEACGTGACAAAAATVKRGEHPPGKALEVRLPGGALQITVRDDLSIEMRGPAVRVFEGTADL